MTVPATLLPLGAAMFAAVIGGTAAVATRAAVADADPTSVAALRVVAGAAFMVALAWTRGTPFTRVAARDWPGLLLLGIGQVTVFSWLFAVGFTYIPAARGALILATMPLMTLLIAAAAGLERLGGAKLAGVALGAVGVAIALGDRAGVVHPEAWKGDLMLAAAALVCSLYNVFSPRYLARYGTLTVTTLGMAMGGAAFVAIVVATGRWTEIAAIGPTAWLAIAYLAVVAGAFNFFLWLWALGRLAPTRVAITVTLNPLAAALLGALLLGEPAGTRLVAGLAVVGAAIWLVNRAPATSAPRPPAGARR